MSLPDPVDDYEQCNCEKCCLPTIVQERDEALLEADRRAADSQMEVDAAVHEAQRCQDDNERLRVSLAIALGLLSEIKNWRHLRGTEMERPVKNFLDDMMAGR